MRRPRTLRWRLTMIAVAVSAIAVGSLVIAFNVLLADSLDNDADSRLRSSAAAALSTVSVDRAGRLRVHEGRGESVLDSGIWVFERAAALEKPRGLALLDPTARAMTQRGRHFRNVSKANARLYSLPVRLRGNQVGTVVAAVSLEAYQRTTDVALARSLALGLLVLLVLAGVVWAVVRRALRPVGEMTDLAAQWGASTPGQRFGAESRPDELGDLARTFDLLLDRVSASLVHEQMLTAELSHELRTPLAKVMAEAELLLRRERDPAQRRQAVEMIHAAAEKMQEILDTLLAAARAAASPADARGDVEAAVTRAVGAVAGTGGRSISWRPLGSPLNAGVDEALIERMLAPLLENATRHARANVEITVGVASGRVTVNVIDDGPGIAARDVERVFEPGVSGSDPDAAGGTGLGLALARRLARSAGGEVRALAADRGHFRIELPAH